MVEMQHKPCREVVENLAATVSRTVSLFNESGNVNKRKHPPNKGTAVLTEIDKLIIMETVLEKPEVYMREIRDTLISETGTEVDISTIWKFLQTSNITRQKMVLVAKQRSDYLYLPLLMVTNLYTSCSMS